MNLSKIVILCMVLHALQCQNFTLTLSKTVSTYQSATYPNDSCKIMQVKSNGIYRLGYNNVFQAFYQANMSTINQLTLLQWALGVLNPLTGLLGPPTLSTPLTYFYVNDQETQVAFIPPNSIKIYNITNLNTPTKQITTAKMESVEYYNSTVNAFYNNNSNAFSEYITQQYSVGGSITSQNNLKINTTSSHMKMVTSNDHNFLIYWDQYTSLHLYKRNLNNSTIPYLYLDSRLSTCLVANLTQTITFSSDYQRMVVEADACDLLRVYDLTNNNLQNYQEFQYNFVIEKALFVDQQSLYLALFNSSLISFYAVHNNFTWLDSHSMTGLSSYVEMQYIKNKLVFCMSNKINVYNLTIILPNTTINNSNNNNNSSNNNSSNNNSSNHNNSSNSSNSSNNSNNSKSSNSSNNSNNSNTSHNFESNNDSLQNDPNNNNSTNNTSNDLIFQFPVIDYSQLQQLYLQYLNQATVATTTVVQKFVEVLSITPVTYLFLSMIQFFSICSLYIFLNVRIPYDLFVTLQKTYVSTNSNLFSLIGHHMNIPMISQEKVTNNKALDMQVSSDFISSNVETVVLLAFFFLVLIVFKIIGKCLDSDNFINRFLKKYASSLIFGQIVTLTLQFVLPASSFNNFSYNSFGDKSNLIVQIIVIFYSFLVPFFYICYLVKSNKIKERNRRKKKEILTETQIEMTKIKYFMMNADEMNQFFIAMVCSFYPLILLKDSRIFLWTSFIWVIFGVLKAFRQQKWRINKIILSMYLLIFHLCFLIFYYCTDQKILGVTCLIGLTVFFIGGVHEFLTIFVETCAFLFKKLQKKCEENKIQPLNLQQQSKQKVEKKKQTKKKQIRFKNTRKLAKEKNEANKKLQIQQNCIIAYIQKSDHTKKETKIPLSKQEKSKVKFNLTSIKEGVVKNALQIVEVKTSKQVKK